MIWWSDTSQADPRSNGQPNMTDVALAELSVGRCCVEVCVGPEAVDGPGSKRRGVRFSQL